MTKRTLYLIALLLLAVAITGCSSTEQVKSEKNDAGVTPSGQSIRLVSDDSGQYSPQEIRVKLGSAVKIVGDPETLVGGMDTVVIDGYGVRKKIAPNDNVIEFAANKPGTFEVVCANGMGNGKLIVE